MYGLAPKGFVYVLCDETGGVLYVGQTTRPLALRLTAHMTKDWWPQVGAIQTTELSQKSLLALEGKLIHAAHPPYNRSCPKCTYYQALRKPPGLRKPRKPKVPKNPEPYSTWPRTSGKR